MLSEFIALNRDEIIHRCQTKVARRAPPLPVVAEIDHGVPVFLAQLTAALEGLDDSGAIGRTGFQHGTDLLAQGHDVSQVVHAYGDVCQSITELAYETHAPIDVQEFRLLNRCLDDAIAGAVTAHAMEGRTAHERETASGIERLGVFAHELRNLTQTAVLAFEVLKTGDVGVHGSTGGVLGRALGGLQALIDRSLSEVRLTRGVQQREVFAMSGFIDEIAAAGRLGAAERGLTLVVPPVEGDVMIDADRRVLGAVVTNLLQNAFKFTRPASTVTLRVDVTRQHVCINVEDECGGLPAGAVDELFRPFEQRGTVRTGLGLGLAFSRWGVEANGGRISARSIADRGCVFTIELPRVAAGRDAPAS